MFFTLQKYGRKREEPLHILRHFLPNLEKVFFSSYRILAKEAVSITIDTTSLSYHNEHIPYSRKSLGFTPRLFCT